MQVQGRVLPLAGQLDSIPATTIPWYCWESPGFKEQHKLAYATAQKIALKENVSMDSPEAKNAVNALAMQAAAHLCKKPTEPFSVKKINPLWAIPPIMLALVLGLSYAKRSGWLEKQ